MLPYKDDFLLSVLLLGLFPIIVTIDRSLQPKIHFREPSTSTKKKKNAGPFSLFLSEAYFLFEALGAQMMFGLFWQYFNAV